MAKQIMIVDDDRRLRDMYQTTLVTEGYEVILEEDGDKALKTILEDKPDLILLDIMMPKISGVDVLDIIKATPSTKDIKVIMLTALSDEVIKGKTNKYHADGYLVKSETSISEVLSAIKNVI